MRNLPPLNSIRAFEAAARHLSFQKAAGEMNVTPSALSYQIKQLEDHVGVPLFRRLNRAVELTIEGQAIRPKVAEGFSALEAAFALIRPQERDRKLVVSTGPAFSAKWLAPRLHGFIEHYPDIDFRLSASLKLVDFITDGVDAAIRFGSGNYPGLYVEPMFTEVSTPVLSPTLFATLGEVADATLFAKTRLLHDDSVAFLPGARNWDSWLSTAGFDNVEAERGMRFNHADHAIDAAIDGGGIALGRLSLAWRDLKAGRLVAPFKVAVRPLGGFFFVCPPQNLEKYNVIHFLAWLRDEVADQGEAVNKFIAAKTIV